MADLLECVPNFSEGRNPETITAIGQALTHDGVRLLDTQADSDHNRSVFTVIGPATGLIEALLAAARVAFEHIDLTSHEGAHPRSGAMDVVPFIPLSDTPMTAAVETSHQFGRMVNAEFSVPVYFYEESAIIPERRNLERIRGKGFEDLRDSIAKDPTRMPDIGSPHLHPTAGAVITGARHPLIAYNIYLGTSDVAVAKAIAKSVRHSSGGLRYVKALGFPIPERSCVQVSMNLTDPRRSAIHTVFQMVREAAAAYGVEIIESEVVGLTPASALIDVARHYLRMHQFRNDQVLELRLLEDE